MAKQRKVFGIGFQKTGTTTLGTTVTEVTTLSASTLLPVSVAITGPSGLGASGPASPPTITNR